MKFFNYKLLLFMVVMFTSFVGCESDSFFEDQVPDYTYSIMRSFAINDNVASIDHTTGTVNFTLAAGSSLSAVPVSIGLPEGATVSPASGSTVDFSNGPVIFTVTNNGVSREYTVTVNAFGTPEITSFAIGSQQATINQATGEIILKISSLDNIRSVAPLFTIPSGATVTPASGVAQDFSNPVKYRVLSNDGFTGKTYTVITDQFERAEITDFRTSQDVCSVSGVIDEDAGTISVFMPAGANLAAVAPVISTPQSATLSPLSGVSQDFSNGSITYSVTNTEGVTREYEVTISTINSTKDVVFIGEADCVNTLQDDDAKAAARYLQAQYPNDFAYIKIEDLSSTALADSKVVMLYYLTPLVGSERGTQYSATPDNILSLLPAELQPGTSQTEALTNWVKGGGNLFVAGDPTAFVKVMGRMPADYSAPRGPGNYRFTEFGCAGVDGCVDYNKPADDIWGLGMRDANNSGNQRNHPIFNDLTFEGDGELYLNNAGTREVRLIWHQQMDGILSPGCCGQDAALLFEQTVQATKFGTLRWIGDAFGYGAMELKATNGSNHSNFDTNIPTDFAGHIISLENTITGYEFDDNEGRDNDYQGNIELLTSNIIDYLKNLN